jgi:hypothetical protein
MFTYKIIEETLISQIFEDDVLIDEKCRWESVIAGQNWCELVVEELNNGINTTRFDNVE